MPHRLSHPISGNQAGIQGTRPDRTARACDCAAFRRIGMLTVFLAGTFQATTTYAQAPQQNPQRTQAPALSTNLSARDYVLGPGDMVDIAVFGVGDFRHEVRVSSSGTITLPLVGRITVDGLTAEELEKRVTAMLTELKLVKDPQVTVFIKEYRSQPVYVLGAVTTPGQYMITHRLRLLDAISLAGGIDTRRADDYLVIQRRPPATTSEASSGAADPNHSGQVDRIDLKKLLEGGDASLNVTVQGGDIVQVPERKIEVFYVVGEVVRSGAFEFPKDRTQKVMASQALAWAGGALKTAKLGKGSLVRYGPDGQPQTTLVDFGSIYKGKKADLQVQPNDIIFLPGSTIKTLGMGLIGSIPSTMSNAAVYRAY
jgi:polysaccharide biosynthesis/export protein